MRVRGLSLVETLITFSLLLLAVGLVLNLGRMYADVTEKGSEADRALEAGQIALARIRTESQEAIRFIRPAPTGSYPTGGVSELVFERVISTAQSRPNPADNRFPSPPYPEPTPWLVDDPEDLVEVRYHLASNSLIRTETTISNGSQSQLLVDELNGFACKLLGPRTLEVVLSVQSDTAVVPLRIEVFLPVEVL